MTLSEQRRDVGVIFENTEPLRPAESRARREEGTRLGESESNREVEVVFEAKEAVKPAKAVRAAETERARREEEAPPIQTERSHDAGVVFENTRDREQPERPAEEQGDGSLTGLLFSMAGLGGAATKFTMDQMKYAYRMMVDPFHAIGHMQQSIDKFSTALNKSVEGTEAGAERRE